MHSSPMGGQSERQLKKVMISRLAGTFSNSEPAAIFDKTIIPVE
jgi:hypothetical protein